MPQPPRSGSEIRIAGNPQLYFREQNAKIVALQDGGFIAAWHRLAPAGQSIQAQIYNADGTKRGNEFAISAPTETEVGNPDVTVLTNGHILVAWESTYIPASPYDPRDKGINAQIITSDGVKLGESFPATGILGAGVDTIPKVTALANGRFMIAWSDQAENSSDSSFAAYEYDGPGRFTRLEGIEASYKSPQGDVTGLKGGGRALVATVLETARGMSDGSGTSIYMNFYKDGTAADYIDARGRVNISTTGDQHQASAVTLSNGNVVFVWTDENPAADGSGSCIKARMFSGIGASLSGEILVNTTKAGYQNWPVIEALSDGGFVIAFVSRDQKNDHDVRVATFGAGGARTSDDFIATGITAGNQINPSLAALKDGRFVVSWTDADLSTRAQVFGTESSGGGDSGTGGGGTGGGGGNPDPVPNILTGDDGDNQLDGTKVQGLIDGRGGRDTVTYQAAESSVVILLKVPGFNAGHAGGDTFKDIEVFIGSAHDDELFGDDQVQELQGADGHDLLRGYGGNDALTGGNGNDTLAGGEGADWLDGGTGVNVASYDEAAGGVTASLQSSGANTGEAAGDTYNFIQNLTGSRFHDTLIGDSGSNTLVGGEGNDRLVGGEGADHLIGGDGDDTLDGGGGTDILEGGAGRNTYVNADQDQIVNDLAGSFDVFQATSHFVLNEASAIEGIVADPDAGAINLTGNRSANSIIGNKDKNILTGLDGDDILSGAGGNDDLRGDLGHDVLTGGTGKDKLTGGAGRDMFVFADKETGSSKSNADTITDFSGRRGDKIDLKAVDANTKKRGDQKFSFIGDDESFSKAGEVRFEKTKGYTYVYLNTDNDRAAEAVIKIRGSLELQKSWFVL
jgi:Ca2+-binding RTX toxin-like protein